MKRKKFIVLHKRALSAIHEARRRTNLGAAHPVLVSYSINVQEQTIEMYFEDAVLRTPVYWDVKMDLGSPRLTVWEQFATKLA